MAKNKRYEVMQQFHANDKVYFKGMLIKPDTFDEKTWAFLIRNGYVRDHNG